MSSFSLRDKQLNRKFLVRLNLSNYSVDVADEESSVCQSFELTCKPFY